MHKVLYIGRFELPDREATAHRVTANAKLLRELGCEVTLAGWSQDVKRTDGWKRGNYFGFSCFEKHKAETSFEKFLMFADASPELSLLRSGTYDMVIAYDFPAIALKKILHHCRACGVLCIGDVSEWYTNSNKNPLFRLVRAYDSHLRMKVLHPKMDGLFVISKYLQSFYTDCRTLLLPPLIDKEDPKWLKEPKPSGGTPSLVYAGWPSKSKERLDLLVDSIAVLSQKQPVRLDIVGVTKEAYAALYGLSDEKLRALGDAVCFHGRLSHTETLTYVKNAAYAVIARESCRKNDAGFPSKLVESISCGTPVLTTPISNVTDYVGEGNNGYILSLGDMAKGIETALGNIDRVTVDADRFDYRQYTDTVKLFLEGCK